MSYRRYALGIGLVFSSLLAVAIYNGNKDSTIAGKPLDIATVANAAVISQEQPDPCASARTQPEMNVCAKKAFGKADAELNKVYKRIIAKLNAADRTNLTEAQRAWLKYRDTHCWAERELYHGGSVAPTVEAACLENTTVARTKDLIRVYETEYDR
jgi:uncharacterized protein YecT (DUF1311 family)